MCLNVLLFSMIKAAFTFLLNFLLTFEASLPKPVCQVDEAIVRLDKDYGEHRLRLAGLAVVSSLHYIKPLHPSNRQIKQLCHPFMLS